VKYVVNLVGMADPATPAMCAVAHVNLGPVLLAADMLARKSENPSISMHSSSACNRRLAKVANDPVNSRRLVWFATALDVRRLVQFASRDPSLVEHALGRSGSNLQMPAGTAPICFSTTPSERPKKRVQFDLTRPEKDGVRYVMTLAIPKAYHRHRRAGAFAEQHDFLLLP
jgi:hypothetical protein